MRSGIIISTTAVYDPILTMRRHDYLSIFLGWSVLHSLLAYIYQHVKAEGESDEVGKFKNSKDDKEGMCVYKDDDKDEDEDSSEFSRNSQESGDCGEDGDNGENMQTNEDESNGEYEEDEMDEDGHDGDSEY